MMLVVVVAEWDPLTLVLGLPSPFIICPRNFLSFDGTKFLSAATDLDDDVKSIMLSIFSSKPFCSSSLDGGCVDKKL
jgi:hypothetical protein